jgi:6-phosphogluconolactonase
MKKIFLHLLLISCITAAAQNGPYLLVGTYTGGKSQGIYVYKFNSLTGDNSFVSTVNSSNPSFIAVSPNQRFVYAVNENADSTRFVVGGNISAFKFNSNAGTLTEINKQPSGGKHPCYVAIDKTGRWVFAANYSSGSLGMLHANANGSLDSLHQWIQHEGSGPNKDRQQGPHVHSTILSPDNKYLFVCDLGTDKVTLYSFDNKKGKLKFASEVNATPGSGPRHLDFSHNGKVVYVAEELSATICSYTFNNGNLKLLQRTSVLPADFKGAIGVADIHVSPNGKFVYCSDRGDDNTISIFSVNAVDGKLTLVGHQSTLGKGPRNFNFDPSGNFLLAANQNSDTIIIFKVDKKTGLLTDTHKTISIPSPVCVKWIR